MDKKILDYVARTVYKCEDWRDWKRYYVFMVRCYLNKSKIEELLEFFNMANAFSQRGYKVIAICNDSPEKKLAYRLREEIVFINLGLGKITVPVEKKILREILKPFQLEIDNPVDIYRTEVLAAEVQKKIKNSEIYCAVCFEYNSIMVANKLEIKPRIAMDVFKKQLSEFVYSYREKLPLYERELERANKDFDHSEFIRQLLGE